MQPRLQHTALPRPSRTGRRGPSPAALSI